MSQKWSAEEEQLLRLLLPTNTHQEISEEINRRVRRKLHGFVEERSCEAVQRKCRREDWTPDNVTDEYSARFSKMRAITERYRLASETTMTGANVTATRKILSISDLHYPFARQELVERVLREHEDAWTVVVNGDLLDGYTFSTFPKSKRIPALMEYRAAFELIKILSETFENVVLVQGNHDSRAAKALGKANFHEEETQIFKPDLLARIANGEELDRFGEVTEKHDFENVHYQQQEAWWTQIGKTIFAHPTGFKDGPGGTVQKLDQIFSSRFGGRYDSLVIGHTHKIYKGVYQNRLLIEQGALSGRQDYEHKADLRFSHAMCGYAVIWQDAAGNTDFNRSGPVYLGSEKPFKNKIL